MTTSRYDQLKHALNHTGAVDGKNYTTIDFSTHIRDKSGEGPLLPCISSPSAYIIWDFHAMALAISSRLPHEK
jgi:hypothetical protein